MIVPLDVVSFLNEQKALGPVKTHQLYFGNSNNFHPDGLYSEDLFGIEGSPERRKSFSWIELNCNVIHPVIYDILSKRIFRKIGELISGEKQFYIDDNGHLIEDMDEGTLSGMVAFYENIHKIKFVEGEDEEGDRNKIINTLYEFIEKDIFFINKFLVISPDYRPVVIKPDTEEVNVDDITKMYQKIIMISTQAANISGFLLDNIAHRMQLAIREFYELIKLKISKKEGMVRNLMLGRRVDYSARSVIAPDPTLDLQYVGVPFRIVCQTFEPHILHGLTNSPYASSIPASFHEAVKKFLDKETLYD